jgi:hypothetical protein
MISGVYALDPINFRTTGHYRKPLRHSLEVIDAQNTCMASIVYGSVASYAPERLR